MDDATTDADLVAATCAFLDDPDARRDPAPLYRRLTTEAPVLALGDGRWVIGGHDAITTVLRSPHVTTSVLGTPWAGDAAAGHDDALGALARTFVNEVDGDPHTRISHALGVPWILTPPEQIQAWAREAVDDGLAQAGPDGELDLVEAIFRPLPGVVMAKACALDLADLDRLRAWASAIGAMPMPASMQPPGWRETAVGAAEELVPFVEQLIAARRADPGDDLLSLVITKAGDTLDHDELVSIITGLCVGGQDSVTGSMASTTAQLLAMGLLDDLRADPDAIDLAVWEAQRLDGPHRFTLRYAAEDFELDGRAIAAGDLLLAFLAAGNRDPQAFPDPDTFVLDRHAHVSDHTQGHNLSHSFGPHHCAGTTLAHVMMEAAYRRLLERTTAIEPTTDLSALPRSGNLLFALITSLPASVTLAG